MRNRVASFRSLCGLTVTDLAKALDVSRQTIAAIEKGKYDPSLPLAERIACVFGVAIEDAFPASDDAIVPTTATFVMTDIVGSTPLAAALAERYVDLLRRHRELVVEVLTRHGGRVVDDTGDACFAAFADARLAVDAATLLQDRMARESWTGGSSVRIRIGIHLGDAYAVGNRFVGLAVHETARVCSAAGPGQVLLSESAARAVGSTTLPSALRHLEGIGPRLLYVA